MFELIIKFADGTVYWRERFISLYYLNRWLSVEQTRPYWKQEFVTEIVDHTPPPPTQEELDARAALKLQINTLKARVKALATQSDLTAAEVKEAIMKYLRIRVLRKEMEQD